MTISTANSKTVAQGNGATTSFAYSFFLPTIAYLYIYYTDANGNVTLLPQSSYSVTGIGSPNGGTITYPLTGSPIALGTSLNIQRVLPIWQLSSLSNQGGYYPAVVESALDYLTMLIQQLSQGASAGLQTPFVEAPFLAGVGFTPGTTTALTLSQNYGTSANVEVHFDGIYQQKSTYVITGTTLTFGHAIPFGVQSVEVVGGFLNTGGGGGGGGGSMLFGPTASRPVPSSIGEPYFDTDLGYQINVKTISPAVWVDTAGATV